MSPADIQIILHRLDQLEATLKEIHVEVKRTNGRVTQLEKNAAAEQAADEAVLQIKRGNRMTTQQMMQVAGTIVGGGMLALIIWFVGHSVN